jgi:hypothetical protein
LDEAIALKARSLEWIDGKENPPEAPESLLLCPEVATRNPSVALLLLEAIQPANVPLHQHLDIRDLRAHAPRWAIHHECSRPHSEVPLEASKRLEALIGIGVDLLDLGSDPRKFVFECGDDFLVQRAGSKTTQQADRAFGRKPFGLIRHLNANLLKLNLQKVEHSVIRRVQERLWQVPQEAFGREVREFGYCSFQHGRSAQFRPVEECDLEELVATLQKIQDRRHGVGPDPAPTAQVDYEPRVVTVTGLRGPHFHVFKDACVEIAVLPDVQPVPMEIVEQVRTNGVADDVPTQA